jgi:hypothetical protein
MGRIVATYPSTEAGHRAANIKRLTIEDAWKVDARVVYGIDEESGNSTWQVLVEE